MGEPITDRQRRKIMALCGDEAIDDDPPPGCVVRPEEDELPTMECPRCHASMPDYDGFGVLIHDACDYCSCPSITGDVCDGCGREAPF